MNYYNENDPKAAEWLRQLIAAGQIPPGDVDERSIIEVKPNDLKAYVQCHFFAGIGGWAYALRLAGWPEDHPVWTGSCPCQPFSAAGKNDGLLDARHLWPAFRRLISERSPPRIFGEQVASKSGRAWLAGVRSDLEGLGYAVGGADLCAAGVGAPHIRQRLYWVADAAGARRGGTIGGTIGGTESQARDETRLRVSGAIGGPRGMADSDPSGRCEQRGSGLSADGETSCWNHPDRRGASVRERERESRLGDSNLPRPQRRRFNADEYPNQQPPWSASEFIDCTDGKARRVEPGTFPLAHGVSGRVGLLRGYGNAIVPQVAAAFIQACEEALTP